MPVDLMSTALSGIGISVVGLCLLRTWRSRSWGCVSRIARLRDKTLAGQVIVVTGGNTGLGFKAAEDFARRGAASVILACRNMTRGAEAATKIRESTGNDNVECMKLDLASLQNVRSFSEQILERFPKIDCLVCNAGVWFPMDQEQKTADNFEAHVGVNHLAHFLLTNLLIAKTNRVVIVSSGLMLHGKIDVDDSRQFLEGRREKPGEKLPKYAPVGYCDSKFMNAMFSRELANRFPDVKVICVGPGWCKTELARNVKIPWYKKVLFAPIAFMFMRSSSQGAQNIIHAVVEDNDKLESGYFYRDFKKAEKENKKVDANMADISERFWSMSDDATK